MGTRHLIAVFSGGQYRVAQYGQWDGYPEGQGKTVRDFAEKHLVDPKKREAFKAKVEGLRFFNEAETQALYATIGVNRNLITMEESKRIEEKYPTLHRNVSGEVLEMIAESKPDQVIPLVDSLSFAKDSLFCEWAYVIDLDKDTFEVYKGFNKTPLPSGRFAHMEGDASNGYHPITMTAFWPLDRIPSDDDFLKQFDTGEE